jgi:hypothetical protein
MRDSMNYAIWGNGYTFGSFNRFEIYRKGERMSRMVVRKISMIGMIRFTQKIFG